MDYLSLPRTGRQYVIGLGLAWLSAMACAQPLSALSDADMSGIAGGDGIAMDIGYQINATLSGNTVTKVPCSIALTPTASTECRMALKFADRNNVWLVLKDYYGVIALNSVWVDAATLKNSDSPAGCLGTPGGPAVGCRDITTYLNGYNPNGKPAIQLSYDHSALTNIQAYYGDALYYLNAGRVTTEFDCGPGMPVTTCASYTPGYLRNQVTGAPLSIRAADGPNASNGPAQIRFDGRMQMYGFGF